MAELIGLLIGAVAVSAIAARWKFAYRDARSVQTYHSALEHLEHIDGGSRGSVEAHVKVLPDAQLRFPQMSPAIAAKRKPAAARSAASRSAATPPGVSPAGLQPRVLLPAAGRKLVVVDGAAASAGAAAGAAASAGAGATAASAGAGATAASARVAAAARVAAGPVATQPVAARRRPAGRVGAPEVREATPGSGMLPERVVKRVVKRVVRPVIRTAAVAAATALVAVVATLSIHSDGSSRGGTLRTASSAGTAERHEPKAVTSAPPASSKAPPAPRAAGSTADTATYEVSSGPVDLTLVAVRRCWVELRTGTSTGPTAGATAFEGILSPGETKSFPALPGLWLRIGNPAGLNVLVDGTAIPLPPAAIPYEVTVESTAASSAASSA